MTPAPNRRRRRAPSLAAMARAPKPSERPGPPGSCRGHPQIVCGMWDAPMIRIQGLAGQVDPRRVRFPSSFPRFGRPEADRKAPPRAHRRAAPTAFVRWRSTNSTASLGGMIAFPTLGAAEGILPLSCALLHLWGALLFQRAPRPVLLHPVPGCVAGFLHWHAPDPASLSLRGPEPRGEVEARSAPRGASC